MIDEFYKELHDKLSQWVSQTLSENIIAIKEIAATRYSYVLQIQTDSNLYYLKHAPDALYFEKEILAFFTHHKFSYTPHFVHYNDDLNCFLIHSCGDETLRSTYKQKFGLGSFAVALENYIDIQKSSINHQAELLTMGTPHWSLENFPALYNAMLHDAQYMQWLGLNEEQLALLRKNHAVILKLCDNLKQYNLPDVLNNCDFQDNNVVINHNTKALTLIDWGEVYIGNPLMSLKAGVMHLTYVKTIGKNDENYTQLVGHVFEQWSISKKHHKELDSVLDTLDDIYYVLTFYNLSKMIGYNFPNWREKLLFPLNKFMHAHKNLDF